MRLFHVGIVVLAMFIAPATALVGNAHAGGFIDLNAHDDEPFYFHATGGGPHDLNVGRYADVTIEYDGATVCSNVRIYNERNNLGGHTTDLRSYKGKAYVKFVFYERDGRVIRQDTWTRELKEGSNIFEHRDTTWHWGLRLDLKRTNPSGRSRSPVDVAMELQ